jgi:hypothetical protein
LSLSNYQVGNSKSYYTLLYGSQDGVETVIAMLSEEREAAIAARKTQERNGSESG